MVRIFFPHFFPHSDREMWWKTGKKENIAFMRDVVLVLILLIKLADPARFELATPAFGGQYSVAQIKGLFTLSPISSPTFQQLTNLLALGPEQFYINILITRRTS